MHRFISQLEHLLTMLVLLLLGASMSWGLLADLTWRGRRPSPWSWSSSCAR